MDIVLCQFSYSQGTGKIISTNSLLHLLYYLLWTQVSNQSKIF